MSKLKDLQEKRMASANVVKELAAKQNEWTAEQRAQWDEANKAYDAIGAEIAAEIEREKNSEAVQQRMQQIENELRAANGDRRIGLEAAKRTEATPEAIETKTNETRTLALSAWFRAGKRRELSGEQRTACMAIGVDPYAGELELRGLLEYSYTPSWVSGGVQQFRELRAGLDVATTGAGKETIPAGFLAELDRKMLAYNGPRNVARVIRTASGNSLPCPKVDDTSNTGELLAEATSIGSTVDPTFSAVTLGAYKFSSKPILISQELIEDSAFNLSSEISSMLAERLGRVQATYNTTGTGSSQPEGIVTGSAAGVTAASATAFTADEVLDLIHSVDPSYRSASTGFMLHDTIIKYLRKMKTADGQFLWQPGLQAGVADRLAGYPITLNQNMDSALTTGKKLLLFGDFSKFYIRDVANVRFYRLDELYRATDQSGFVSFLRMDSKVLQSAAIKRLTLA